MRILFLSAWFPFPANNGSKLRIYNLLRRLAERYEVTLVSFADQPDADSDVPELRQICREVRIVPVSWFDPHSLRARLGFFSLKPRSVVDTFSPQMAEVIVETLTAVPHDLIIASQTRMAGYWPYFGGVPALFEEVEVGVLYEEYAQAASFKQRLRTGLMWAKHRHYMAGLLGQFAASTVASEPERELLRREVGSNGHRVEVLPNCIDVASYANVSVTPQPNTLVYTGSFSFAPNYEAMEWFVLQVLPLVQAQVPNVRLVITGDQAGRPLPPAKNVQHVGFVDDVRTYVAAAWISLAPLQTGGGTRLKILEAMALHTPVIATSKGAQGLDAQPGEHFLQADTPEAFAAAVVRLLKEADLRYALTEKAYDLVRRTYDYTAVSPKLLQLVEDIAHARE